MVDVPKILKGLYAERDLIVEVITMLEKLNTTAVTEPAAMESVQVGTARRSAPPPNQRARRRLHQDLLRSGR